MITERKEDLTLMEVDRRIEKMLEKYLEAFLGDRLPFPGTGQEVGEVEDAEETNSQTG
jgi:hypothetical protein